MLSKYFDYNATTPMFEQARETWLSVESKYWYNASALYKEGASARHYLEELREDLAERLKVVPERVLFTSGATEANNSIFWDAYHRGVRKFKLSHIEHPSVAKGARIKGFDAEVSEFDPSNEASLSCTSGELVSLMAANNESGWMLPWELVATRVRQSGALFHTDAVQWLGKMKEIDASQVDYLTASAHKFGGPRGVGFLILPEDERLEAYMKGGAQEERRRAGTENLAGIAAMLKALECADRWLDQQILDTGRNLFEAELKKQMPELSVLHEDRERLWNTSLLVMPRHDQRKWVARLSQLGFALSTGSACSAGSEGASRVAEALGLDLELRRRVIRVSGGWQTRPQDWLALSEAFGQVLRSLDEGLKAI